MEGRRMEETMRFGVFALIQHPLGENPVQKYAQLIEQTQLLEKSGYYSVWLGEHHSSGDIFFPTLLTLGGIASNTKKIKIGTNILVLPLHHPIQVAEEMAMLDVMSNGRMIPGVAIGYRVEEFQAFNVPPRKKTSILEEQVPLLKRLWSETKVTHHGKYFNFESVAVNPKPVQKNMPIWIGASGAAPDSALDRIARLGDAWLADQSTPLSIHKKKFEYYRSALRKYGKDPNTMDFPLLRELYIADNLETARKDVEKEMIGKYRLYYKWELPILRTTYGSEEEITFDSLRKDTVIVGDPDEVISQIEKYQKELGINHMILRIQFKGFDHEKTLSAIKLFGDKVIPYFSSS
jgi:alkanesulfonate monooxygenase SsuD/methylene tetrahydromethanopterin reductase-like flavin-dependent oxidoreductase (luciferase family)